MKQRMNNEVSRLVRVANQSGRLKRRQQAAEQEAERTLCGWLGISREELKQANIPEWRDALNGSEPLTAERATALLSRLRGHGRLMEGIGNKMGKTPNNHQMVEV